MVVLLSAVPGAYRNDFFERARALYDEVEGKKDVEQFISELQEAMNDGTDYSAMLKWMVNACNCIVPLCLHQSGI